MDEYLLGIRWSVNKPNSRSPRNREHGAANRQAGLDLIVESSDSIIWSSDSIMESSLGRPDDGWERGQLKCEREKEQRDKELSMCVARSEMHTLLLQAWGDEKWVWEEDKIIRIGSFMVGLS